jgi:methyl-accepting chemotaxis protein
MTASVNFSNSSALPIDSNAYLPSTRWSMPGIALFRRMSLAIKAIVLGLLTIAILLVAFIYGAKSNDKLVILAQQNATRAHVEIAHAVLNWAYSEEQAGRLSEKQAQDYAINVIANMRYNDTKFFWINDMSLKMIMHPIRTQLNNTDVSSIEDANGVALYRNFVDTVRKTGSGLVLHQALNKSSGEQIDKLSYVKGFEPWKWVLGSEVSADTAQQQWSFTTSSMTMLAILVLLISYSFLCFYLSIKQGLREVSVHLKHITQGDLTSKSPPLGRDEASLLMRDLIDMQASLCQMIRQVRDSSEEIVHASNEIASGAMNLSERTENSSHELEGSAASMEQITSSAKHSVENTREASRVARRNADVAATGGLAMREVADTMLGIRTSSSQIREIIGTIDGIAFQTNLLALNAAVEAARAGESGRGFAVVASEVGALATRSADAAREVKVLVSNSVTQVEEGAKVVDRACSTIEEIVEYSHQVDKLLDEVNNASQEQSIGIDNVNQALTVLDAMAQQNVALVAETAASASAMKDQATQLSTDVSRFHLSETLAPIQSVQSVEPVDFDFDTAIEAHRQWKVKLRKAIANQEQLDADTICQDNQCPLGQWIHGDGGDRYSDAPNFQELTVRHAEFHQTAGAVARVINDAHYNDAERLIGSGSHFSQVSTEVCTLLIKAKRRVE